MIKCSLNIDCANCEEKYMCHNYADYMYEKGWNDGIRHFLHSIGVRKGLMKIFRKKQPSEILYELIIIAIDSMTEDTRKEFERKIQRLCGKD